MTKPLGRAADAFRLLLDLVTRDPAFVRGGSLGTRDVPVFTFHSLEPVSFERRLRFLADAGYEALSMAAYLEGLASPTQRSKPAVLLTIDDGRASTWTVGYPLLKKYGMRATAFLVTSAVHESEDVSKTIADAAGEELESLLRRDDSADRPFVTWGEVRAMSDVIDIESHTHLHARVQTGTAIAGVMTAGMQRGYGVFDSPFVWRGGAMTRGAQVPEGTPLPVSEPRLSAIPAYRADEARTETLDEVRSAIAFDLGEARRLIREKAGRDATALCYPWHVHSDLARKLARDAGYVVAFAGKADSGSVISGAHSDRFALARVGEDYVERLPGPGRRPLLSILREKLLR